MRERRTSLGRPCRPKLSLSGHRGFVLLLAPSAGGPLGTYTNFVNLLDLCALTVPGPFRGDGFPSSVTLIATAGCEDRLAAVGEALHRRAGVPFGTHLS
jgi:Asp-tRNA(Asn)/Glu-tRNA(Gln) amidotransferase A subunit family amidase